LSKRNCHKDQPVSDCADSMSIALNDKLLSSIRMHTLRTTKLIIAQADVVNKTIV
jgi:hypothetical protein